MRGLKTTGALVGAVLGGCAGGGGGGLSLSLAAPAYVYDQTLAALPGIGDYSPTGLSSSGQWVGVGNVSSTTGELQSYYVNGVATLFSTDKITGSGIDLLAAGGDFVWAEFSPPNGFGGVAILDRTTGSIAQNDNVSLTAISPNGQLAFGKFLGSEWSYGIVFADGSRRTFRPAGQELYQALCVSNAGWAVVYSGAPPGGLEETGQPPLVTPPDAGESFVVSPDGGFQRLQGESPEVSGVNNEGVSVGSDYYPDGNGAFTEAPTKWDRHGNETRLKNLIPGNLEYGACINDAGLIAGGSAKRGGQPVTAVLWQPNGTVVNLSSRARLPAGVTLSGTTLIQNNGELIGYTKSSSGRSKWYLLWPTG